MTAHPICPLCGTANIAADDEVDAGFARCHQHGVYRPTPAPSPAEEARRERYLRVADDLIQRGIDAESAEAACAYHYAAHQIIDVGRSGGPSPSRP